MTAVKTWLYYGHSVTDLEDQVNDLVDRGAVIVSVSIAYGPPPSRTGTALIPGPAFPDAPEASWHALIVADTTTLRLD